MPHLAVRIIRQEHAALAAMLRCPALLDRLDDDHARGERKIRNVEHALLGFEMMGESRRMEFESAVGRFADFYLEHMALEERDPAARRKGAHT